MKKIRKLVIIATALLFMAGYTASAQAGHNHSNKKEQKQGMMLQKKGMMQDMTGKGMCPMCGQMMKQNMPMKKYMMMVNRLPMMQQQLSLDQNQVEQLIDLQTEFKKQQIDYKAELRKKQMKLKSLLEDNTSASQVKNQMQACSETKINMKVDAYETAGKMKSVLNSDQKQQLQNMMMQQSKMMDQGQNRMMQNHNNQ